MLVYLYFLKWNTNSSHHKLGCNKCISNTTQYNWITVMQLNKLNEYFNNYLEVYSVIIKTQVWVSPAKNYYEMLIILLVCITLSSAHLPAAFSLNLNELLQILKLNYWRRNHNWIFWMQNVKVSWANGLLARRTSFEKIFGSLI